MERDGSEGVGVLGQPVGSRHARGSKWLKWPGSPGPMLVTPQCVKEIWSCLRGAIN